MKKLFTLLFLSLFTSCIVSAQTISEKEIFNLKYKGSADTYSLNYDTANGNYCYVYSVPGEGKMFVISIKTLSDKYDYIVPRDIKFDSKGNYYVITSDYKPDFGTNNYFLVVNGKEVRNGNYLESYSSYINKKDEFVFLFKENEMYRIGYYNPVSGFHQSEPYDLIRTAFSYAESMSGIEGDGESYDDEDFYHNEKGERAFIATVNGKSKIIFETSEVETDYSDINESSLTLNKNNELSFIAKKGGRFYELYGNEFVVSGNKEYNKFDIANMPLLFNQMNEPVYIAGDSVGEDKLNYFVVVGNEVQTAYLDPLKTEKAPDFSSYITNLKLNDDGSITYFGNGEVTVPGINVNPYETFYDQYYQRSFFVKNGIANELGYNINRIEYNDSGAMLYSGIPDLQKKQNLLMMNYGESRIIINKNMFDEIYEYGFAPTGEIYYMGQDYADTSLKKDFETSLFLGDKLLDKNYYFVYQTDGDDGSVLKFDSENNYAFVTERKVDSITSEYTINTNSGKLPFPENVSGSKAFTYVSNLMYVDDKLFYIGDMKTDPLTYEVVKELFYENKSLGKTYNMIDYLDFDEVKDQITFRGARGSKIYLVTVQL